MRNESLIKKNSRLQINPFYAGAGHHSGEPHKPSRPRRVYAVLPDSPRNGSPVPHLTSLYHFNGRGDYGNSAYPGNCGGNIIRDLLQFFQPRSVFDPMTGSGTCADVCRELQVPCLSKDIRDGFDACDATSFKELQQGPKFDLIWAHPPYWRQKLYTSKPGDLSRTDTLDAFLELYGSFVRNCASVLSDRGKLIILMGDYQDRDAGFISLTQHTKELAVAAGLRQHCTDIIRFSHGASSSRKTYRSSFIPSLHDVCMIFEGQPKSRSAIPTS